ncbi:Lysosome-associated membrane glycoprotein 1 [Mactra antiquata]
MMKTVVLAFCIMGFDLRVKGAEFRFGEESKDPCILLNLDATFNLTLEENNVTRTAPPFNLEGAMVHPNKSICGTETEAAVLTVQIFPSNERLTFRFIRNNDNVEMSVVLDMVPGKHFDDQNTTTQFEIDSDTNLYIGALTKSSYKCLSEQVMVFNKDEPFNMTMTITNLQVQAYNIEGDTFGPVVECSQDIVTTPGLPTTEPPPETTPSTTIPSTVPVYVVRQDNKACIVLKARLKLNIKYVRYDEEPGEVSLYVPQDAKVGGNCGADDTMVQNINLTFFETNWLLEIDIKKDLDLGVFEEDEDFEFHWERVRLTFDVDNHFDDAVDAGQVKTVETEMMDHEFTASFDGSFKCNSKQTIELSNDVTMATSDLQYKAFSESDDINFSDEDVTECDADNDDDDGDRRVLITVLGSVFGGLAVVLFTIGFIWKVRSRKRVNYELLAGVSYDRSVLRSDTSMDKRMY